MERIGQYLLEGELARGGMGVVYRGRDEETGRPVAIKLLLARKRADEKANRRFLREGRALAKLRHPNVVAIHACGECEQGPYLVLDLIQGVSLDQRLQRTGPLEPEQVARIGVGLADALDHAHLAGVVHRDVKPANVLLDEAGDPLLTDFGLARDQDPELDGSRLSRTGVFMGTPGYWPPEQAVGDLEQIGPRSDVFSLGATLYELLAGQSPFAASTLSGALALLRAPAQPLRELRPDVPPGLEAICARCLELEPGERYRTARALASDLRAFLAGEQPRALLERGRARSWRPALGLVLLGGVLAGLLVVWRGLPGPAVDAPTPVESEPASPTRPVPSVEQVQGLLAAGDRPFEALDLAVEFLARGDDPVQANSLIVAATLAAWSPRPSWQAPLRQALDRIDGLRAKPRLAAEEASRVLWVAVGDFDKAARRSGGEDPTLREGLRLLDEFDLTQGLAGSSAVSRWTSTVPTLELALAAEALLPRGDPVAWVTAQQLLHGVASLGLRQHLDVRGLHHALRLRPNGPAGLELAVAALGPAAFQGRAHAGGGDYENVFLARDPSEIPRELLDEPRLGADFLLAVRVHEASHDPARGVERYLESRDALVPDLRIWQASTQLRYDAAVVSAAILAVWNESLEPELLGLVERLVARWEQPDESDGWVQLALLASTARLLAGQDATPWAERLEARGATHEAGLVRAEQDLLRGDHDQARARLEGSGWVHPVSQRALLHLRALGGETLGEHVFGQVETLRAEHLAMFPWHAEDAEAVVAGERTWPGR